MQDVYVNYWAILVAAVANMVLGAIWFAPAVFGKSWIKHIGLTQQQVQKIHNGKAYFAAFIAAVFEAFALNYLIQITGAVSISEGLQIAFWVWLGFIATTAASDYLFADRPSRLYAINILFQLAALFLMAMLLTLWL